VHIQLNKVASAKKKGDDSQTFSSTNNSSLESCKGRKEKSYSLQETKIDPKHPVLKGFNKFVQQERVSRENKGLQLKVDLEYNCINNEVVKSTTGSSSHHF